MIQLPLIISQSKILSPFLAWSCLPESKLSSWFQTSTLNQILHSLCQLFIQPIQQVSKQNSRLHLLLNILHHIATFCLILLLSFASTSHIGLGVGICLFILILRWIVCPMKFTLNVLDISVCLFFLTAGITTFFSSYTSSSMIGLAKFSVFFVSYINFRILFSNNPTSFLYSLLCLLCLGLFETFIGFQQYFGHTQALATWQDPSLNPELKLTRIFGTLQPSNPNLLAGFLIPCVASGLALGCRFLFKQQVWLGCVILGLTSPVIITLVLTGSRGGYLALGTMALITFLSIGHLLWNEPEYQSSVLPKSLWLLSLFIGFCVMISAFVALPAIRNRFLSIFVMREDSSNSYRLNVWMSVWRMIQDNWLLGIGPGNTTFKQVYGLYMTPGYNALSAYSIFLEIWVEQGILGILTFGLLVITILFRQLIGFYSQLTPYQKVTIGCLFAGLAGSLVYGLFDTIWYRPSVNILFWLFLAGFAIKTEHALPPTKLNGNTV